MLRHPSPRDLAALLAGALLLAAPPAAAQDAIPLANWTSAPLWTPPADHHTPATPDVRESRQALAVSPTPLPFVALPPCRLVDTRGGAPLAGGFLPPATVRSYTLAGVCGVPANARAVSLNATVVRPTGPGFLTLWPEGGAFPPVSTLNFVGNDIVANAAIVPTSVAGAISMALGGSGGDVILDTNGYYAPVASVASVNGQTGDVTLAPGSNVSIVPAGNTLTIAAGPLVSSLKGLTGPVDVAGTNGLSASAGSGTLTVTSNATPTNVPGAIVSRDPDGSFEAGAVTLSGNLVLSASPSVLAGAIFQGPNHLLHTSGPGSLFLGISAGNFMTNGNGYNVGIGNAALFVVDTGSYNTALGASALTNNAAGSENTAVGTFALALNTAGSGNTAVGNSALNANTGFRNIAVGAGAGMNLTSGDNNIDIGNEGIADESNTVRIGKVPFQSRVFVAGIRGVTTDNSNAIPVLVDSTGQLGTVSSSIRFKEDVRDMGEASVRLLELRPVTFRYRGRPNGAGERHFGLIAEEVDAVLPELVVRSADGQIETVKYHELPAMLLNEIQRLTATVRDLESRLSRAESRLEGAR